MAYILGSITVDELVARVPGTKVFMLPSGWLGRLQARPNVYEQFYGWLEKQGHPDAFRRVRVGKRLMKLLTERETRRRRKDQGLRGEQLEKAIAWVRFDAGPHTIFGRHEIVGEGICLLPADSGEYESSLIDDGYEQHWKAAKRERAKASGSSFYYWLMSATDHDGMIGDIARDIRDVEGFPQESSELLVLRQWLEEYGFDDAMMRCFDEAWGEYTQRYSDRCVSAEQQVYFIQSPDGPIKIGYTSQSVQKRLASLQTAHHGKLSLLATIPGDRSKEQELHSRFASHRLEGEWFEATPVLAWLAEILK